MKQSFWRQNNRWWKEASRQMMCTGLKGERLATADWDEANRRLWCLSYRVVDADDLGADDRADLVQEMLLKLQDSVLLTKLTAVDAPAHYLAEVMRNLIRNEDRRRRRVRRAAPRCARRAETAETDRPDQQAEQKELRARARYVVNHVLRREDRQILWWFYKDELPVAKISKLLGISEMAALQRLSRARKRLRDAFET
jgi:RNA polymerase sigma factor (sigma-70 family)